MTPWMIDNFEDCEDEALRRGWPIPGKRDVVIPRGMWRKYWADMDAYVTIKRVLKDDYREAKPQPPRVPKRAKETKDAKETVTDVVGSTGTS